MTETTLLRTASLLAPDSPRQAFYLLWLEQTPTAFQVDSGPIRMTGFPF
jgi:hypothetical protein